MRVLFSLALLLVPAMSWARYDFSISASPTDPLQHSSSPTGTVRNLYLWITRTDEGISAFEADAIGTLKVLAFHPGDGVVNAGGVTNLLLAVAGCPQGTAVNFLLGYWVVWDDGGTLCLGPSSADNRIGAVNCNLTSRLLTENPRVTGFSSSGDSPCER